MAKIINRYKEGCDFSGQKLYVGDYFGSSKYVLAQGFSYFGDIKAHVEVQNVQA